MKKLGALVLLFPSFVFAQAAATPLATPAVLGAIGAASSAASLHAGTIAIVLGIAAEIGMRIFPTAKPLSFFSLAASALTMLATLFNQLAGILNNVVASKQVPPAA
jgi:hypothetical protein